MARVAPCFARRETRLPSKPTSAGGQSVRVALANLSAQLITDFGLDYQAQDGLLPEWAETPSGFESLLATTADHLDEQRLIMVVDGLEEAEIPEGSLLTERSGGDWAYVRYVLQDVSSGANQLDSSWQNQLPSSLTGHSTVSLRQARRSGQGIAAQSGVAHTRGKARHRSCGSATRFKSKCCRVRAQRDRYISTRF